MIETLSGSDKHSSQVESAEMGHLTAVPGTGKAMMLYEGKHMLCRLKIIFPKRLACAGLQP